LTRRLARPYLDEGFSLLSTGANMALLTDRFDRALAFAVGLHREDLRKGSQTPYVAHLLSVCALVLEDGGTEDEAIAALLHDALEDHPDATDRPSIRREYGERVLALVEGCTDTPADYSGGRKPAWKARKQGYIEHVRHADAGGVRISLADKLHNARAILADYRRIGDALWSRFNVGHPDLVDIRREVLWYYRELAGAFRHAGASGYLIEELERTLEEIDQLILEHGPS
jgi:(p)ppGpp synthase/HD superfamily hydrolase